MPKAQRSRACQQCRERRVKCDETPEICQQCRRLGLKCSGPIVGSVIIDMTERVAKPRPRKKREPSIAGASGKSSNKGSTALATVAAATAPRVKSEPDDNQASANDLELAIRRSSVNQFIPDRAGLPSPPAVPQQWKPSSDQWDEAETDDAIATIRFQYEVPSYYRPAKIVSEALDQAFMTHFVQLNHGMRQFSPEIPWITHLPRLRQNTMKPAMRLAIRAASMAFYATVHKDTTILVDSYRWYTMSLECQRQSIQRIGAHAIPNQDEMLVPLILSLYEVFAGTTSTSIWHHLMGAINIIAMRGPENCKGVAFPMFKAMRVSDAHLSMIFNKPSVFSTPEWMTIPFRGQTKTAHQILADILLVIPDCIRLCNPRPGSMRSFFASPLPLGIDLQPAEQRTRELLRELDDWALDFPNLVSTTGGDQLVTSDLHSLIVGGTPRVSSSDESYITLPDSFIALTAATYEANRLVLTLLLDKITSSVASAALASPPPSSTPSSAPLSPFAPSPRTSSSLMDTALASVNAILDISAYIESKHPVGFDLMRSVYPLVVVIRIGPGAEEQRLGMKMLERWGKMKGMAGLCAAWLQEST